MNKISHLFIHLFIWQLALWWTSLVECQQQAPRGAQQQAAPSMQSAGEPQEAEMSPRKVFRKQPVGANRRPPPPPVDPYRDECDCQGDYEDGADYGPERAAMYFAQEPMRHIGRMMRSMFGRMPAAFEAPGSQRGGFVSSSFASSDRDGYSNTASQVVTPDGKVRGIISETRNGRTRTSRFGDGPNEADERDQIDLQQFERGDDRTSTQYGDGDGNGRASDQ